MAVPFKNHGFSWVLSWLCPFPSETFNGKTHENGFCEVFVRFFPMVFHGKTLGEIRSSQALDAIPGVLVAAGAGAIELVVQPRSFGGMESNGITMGKP